MQIEFLRAHLPRTKTRTIGRIALCTILLATSRAIPAQQETAHHEKLGNVHFPASCGADAQRQFDRALAIKKNDAITLLQTAADREDTCEKHVAMENRIWPMRELGELLLALNRPAQALQAFELSLKMAPNRFRGFHGAAKAAERVGNRAEAKRYYEKPVTLCSHADSDRPELAEARAFLAGGR
jgi:tetratricopeptide (TPR) repeat protein